MLGLKRFVRICLMLLLASKVQAQISMSYTMGVVGGAGQTESIFSGAILFDSERCFLLSLATLLFIEQSLLFRL